MGRGESVPVTIQDVRRVTAAEFGISEQELVSEAREFRCSEPRHVAWLMARRFTKCTQDHIGRLIGNVSNVAVHKGLSTIRRRIEKRPRLLEAVMRIEAVLNGLSQAP